MAAITYAGTDFAATFGILPEISRTITREINPQDGRFIKRTDRITLKSHIKGSGADTDALQADLTSKIASLEALSDDGALVFTENDADVAWCYDNAGAANNHATMHGVKIVSVDIPAGPAQHVTNAPYTIVFEAVILETCADDPIVGVQSLSYTINETWDTQGIVSITYTGTMCACDGVDGGQLFLNLVEDVLTPDAKDRFIDAGATLADTFGPASMQRTALDNSEKCWQFTLVYGGGSFSPSDTVAASLRQSATIRLVDNHWHVTITGVYGYRGDLPQTGLGTTGGIHIPIGGSPFGLPGGGASGGTTASFDRVYKDAIEHKGIKARNYTPPGGGSVFLVDSVVGNIDTEAKTITVTKTYHLNWFHDGDIAEYSESATVSLQPETFSGHVLTPTGGVAGSQTYAYPQTSGLPFATITFNVRIVSRTAYKEIAPRISPDKVNVWLTASQSLGVRSIPQDQSGKRSGLVVGGGAGTTKGLFESTLTQTFQVRDLSQLQQVKLRNVGTVSTGSVSRSAVFSHA